MTEPVKEPCSLRVVRVIQLVIPRRLTAQQVMEACPDDASGIVYATLSNLSKDGKGPLQKRRSESGVLDYGITPDFDIAAWIEARKPRRKSAPATTSGEPLGDETGQIIRVLRRVPKRLTSNEIEATGQFADRPALLLVLAKMCADSGPLERDRAGNGSPFMYGIRRDFDVDAWLADQGQAPCADDAPKDSAVAQAPVTARAGERVAAADSRKVESTASVKDTVLARPACAADPRKQGAVDRDLSDRPLKNDEGRDSQHRMPGRESQQARSSDSSVSIATAAPKTAAAQTPATVRPGADVSSSKASSNESAPAAATPARPLNGDAQALATDLVVISAANLAAAIREAIRRDAIPELPDLTRALHNFERADRIYVGTKAVRA